jgi:hypothetical protein
MNTSVGTAVIQGQKPSMNLDAIDRPLSDAAFVGAQVDAIARLATEAERLSAARALLSWEDPGPGGYYDNLQPLSAGSRAGGHMRPGQGPRADPAYYFSPLTTAEPPKHGAPPRLSWTSGAMSFYDTPLVLDYAGLDRAAQYTAEFVFITKPPKPAKPGATPQPGPRFSSASSTAIAQPSTGDSPRAKQPAPRCARVATPCRLDGGVVPRADVAAREHAPAARLLPAALADGQGVLPGAARGHGGRLALAELRPAQGHGGHRAHLQHRRGVAAQGEQRDGDGLSRRRQLTTGAKADRMSIVLACVRAFKKVHVVAVW